MARQHRTWGVEVMLTQIHGWLKALTEPTDLATTFSIDANCREWTLRCEDTLLPQMRSLVDRLVVIDGHQIGEPQVYGDVFVVEKIAERV